MTRLLAALSLVLTLLAPALPATANPSEPLRLVAPGSGEVRALVVGIDQYLYVPQLRGAVADARDISAALVSTGITDLTTLVDKDASRDRMIGELDRLVARTHKGDLIILTLAGHGSKEDERVKGSSTDGTDEVFLLVGFDPKTGPGGAQKVLNHEFRHYIKLLEGKGAEVIFVADTCYGGGLTREVAAGSPGLTYRQVPRYRLAEEDLKPVSTPADAMLTAFDFERTTFLAAVDDDTKAPEVLIDNAYRGALSYAFARAIQGAADEKRDRKITLRELFGYARKVVYQLSDERQNIVTTESPHRDLDRDIVLEWGVRGGRQTATPPAPDQSASTERDAAPIRLASATAGPGVFAGLEPLETPFAIVGLDSTPDLVWDPVAREAVADGDKIALDVGLDDLPGVIDRTAAVRDLKSLVVKAPQDVRVLPDASLHRRGSRIEIDVDEIDGRNLVLVDITGSGVVQLIYPTSARTEPTPEHHFKAPFAVRDPFGADQVLAVTSTAPMDTLVAALRSLDKRRSAGQIVNVIRRFQPPDARLGLVGLFTVP